MGGGRSSGARLLAVAGEPRAGPGRSLHRLSRGGRVNSSRTFPQLFAINFSLSFRLPRAHTTLARLPPSSLFSEPPPTALTEWSALPIGPSVIPWGCLLWPVHSLGKTLLAFALLHSVLHGRICLLLEVFLDFLLLHSSPLYWKGHLFGC